MLVNGNKSMVYICFGLPGRIQACIMRGHEQVSVRYVGAKEVPGRYLSESESENFWLSVLTGLHNRGVNT